MALVVFANSQIPYQSWNRSRRPKKRLSRCSRRGCSYHLRWKNAKNGLKGIRIHRWMTPYRSLNHKYFLVWSGLDSRRPCPGRHQERRCMMAATGMMMTLNFWGSISSTFHTMGIGYSRLRQPSNLVWLLWLRKRAIRAHIRR